MRRYLFFMPLHPRSMARFEAAGFSVLELVMVIVIVGVLAAYAVPRFDNRAAITVPQQADALIRDLRHAQQLAMAWNRPLRFTVTPTDYSVACVTAGVAPCDVAPVRDPARAGAFQVNPVNNVGFTAATIDFDSLGRPNAATAIIVSGGGVTKTVNVAAISGFISRTP